MTRQNIIVGDPHGTIKEFNQLLDHINYDVNKHRIIMVGDLIDRGEDPVGLLRQVRLMNLECALGNHEEKMLRWRRHEDMKYMSGKENPMKEPAPSRKAEWKAFSKEDLKWISELPRKIHIKDNWYAVHAGMESSKLFSEQDDDTIIRVRYVDEKGNFVLAKNKQKPNGCKFWADAWNQPYNLIFGHHKFEEPKIFKNANNTCIGIDTGAVYGGALTAYNLDTDKFISIKSSKTYYKK